MIDAATRVLRRREVQARTGLPTSTLYSLITAGRFPKPIKLGEKAVGWLEGEIEAYLQARIAERDAKSPAKAA